MITRQLEVSILSAPLAAIDRRALSQAWYSALRLARDKRPTPQRHVSNSRDARARKRAAIGLEAHSGDCGEVRARPFVAGTEPRLAVYCGSPFAVAERRAPRSTLARRIESVLFGPRSQVKRASFTIGHGRVHVVLHSKGDRVALVALCSPHLRGIVARALAQARFALAARGIQSQHDARGTQRCS